MPRTLDHVVTRDLTKQTLFEALRSQMQYKASLLGVEEVEGHCIPLMVLALEHHIKSILTNCRSQRLRKKFPKPHLSRSVPPHPYSRGGYLPFLDYHHKEVMDTNLPGTIDLIDMQLTLEGCLESGGVVGHAREYKVIEYANLTRKED